MSYRGRPIAQCGVCGSKERDRLLELTLREVLQEFGGQARVLHASPEAIIRPSLEARAGRYIAVDLIRGLSSYSGQLTAAADLTRLPFEDGAFDVVVASHVLEHIQDDRAAIREIFRVIEPGGFAILPVPIVHAGGTVEYGAPRPDEEMHVRAPGLDYFKRFTEAGFRVRTRRSSDFPRQHQLFSFHKVIEDPAVEGGAGAGKPGQAASEQWMPICRR